MQVAKRREDRTGNGGGGPARLDEPRLEALRKQLRHPYITGQGLEPPQGPEGGQAEPDNGRIDPAASDHSPADLSDTTNQ